MKLPHPHREMLSVGKAYGCLIDHRSKRREDTGSNHLSLGLLKHVNKI